MKSTTHMAGTATTHRLEASSVVKAINHGRKIKRAPRENSIVAEPVGTDCPVLVMRDGNQPDTCWPRTRADSTLAPSQWETSLQSNAVSHWMGANLKSTVQNLRGTTSGLLHQRLWNNHVVVPRGRLIIKIQSCQYRDSHYEDKRVSRPSYLNSGNFKIIEDKRVSRPLQWESLYMERKSIERGLLCS